MKKYFLQPDKYFKPYHLLYGIYLLIIIAGLIYRLWKQS
jgi:hypothetical protein